MNDIMELISRIHLGWKRRVARDLAAFGVNPKQIYLLRKLHEKAAMAPSRIAEMLFADRPTVASMLKTMERAGWISRRRDPANGRQVLVSITAAGRRKLESVPQELWRSGKTSFDPLACLSAKGRVELVRLLNKINTSIEQNTPN